MLQASFKKKLELSRESQLFEGDDKTHLLLVSANSMQNGAYL
jgi:hypothetical protein